MIAYLERKIAGIPHPYNSHQNDVVREWILPFEEVAGRDPKDLMPSGLIVGTAAGEEDIGAEVSSMDPKVTDEPGNV